jgi:hypothetical protein
MPPRLPKSTITQTPEQLAAAWGSGTALTDGAAAPTATSTVSAAATRTRLTTS